MVKAKYFMVGVFSIPVRKVEGKNDGASFELGGDAGGFLM